MRSIVPPSLMLQAKQQQPPYQQQQNLSLYQPPFPSQQQQQQQQPQHHEVVPVQRGIVKQRVQQQQQLQLQSTSSPVAAKIIVAHYSTSAPAQQQETQRTTLMTFPPPPPPPPPPLSPSDYRIPSSSSPPRCKINEITPATARVATATATTKEVQTTPTTSMMKTVDVEDTVTLVANQTSAFAVNVIHSSSPASASPEAVDSFARCVMESSHSSPSTENDVDPVDPVNDSPHSYSRTQEATELMTPPPAVDTPSSPAKDTMPLPPTAVDAAVAATASQYVLQVHPPSPSNAEALETPHKEEIRQELTVAEIDSPAPLTVNDVTIVESPTSTQFKSEVNPDPHALSVPMESPRPSPTKDEMEPLAPALAAESPHPIPLDSVATAAAVEPRHSTPVKDTVNPVTLSAIVETPHSTPLKPTLNPVTPTAGVESPQSQLSTRAVEPVTPAANVTSRSSPFKSHVDPVTPAAYTILTKEAEDALTPSTVESSLSSPVENAADPVTPSDSVSISSDCALPEPSPIQPTTIPKNDDVITARHALPTKIVIQRTPPPPPLTFASSHTQSNEDEAPEVSSPEPAMDNKKADATESRRFPPAFVPEMPSPPLPPSRTSGRLTSHKSSKLTSQQQVLLDESGKMLVFMRKEVCKLRNQNGQLRSEVEHLKESNQRLQEANATAGTYFSSLNSHAKQLNDTNAKLSGDLVKCRHQIQKLNLCHVELKEELRMKQAAYVAEVQSRLKYQTALTRVIDALQDKCRDGRLVEHILTLVDDCESEFGKSQESTTSRRVSFQQDSLHS